MDGWLVGWLVGWLEEGYLLVVFHSPSPLHSREMQLLAAAASSSFAGLELD